MTGIGLDLNRLDSSLTPASRRLLRDALTLARDALTSPSEEFRGELQGTLARILGEDARSDFEADGGAAAVAQLADLQWAARNLAAADAVDAAVDAVDAQHRTLCGGAAPLSLSDLEEKRSSMDRAPWSFEDDRRPVVPGDPTPPGACVCVLGAECHCDDVDDAADPPAAVRCPRHDYVATLVTPPNAVGIVATHGAADALIRIARAALAWRASLDEREDFGARAYRDDPSRITTPEHRAGSARLDERIRDRVAVLRAVLDKVVG